MIWVSFRGFLRPGDADRDRHRKSDSAFDPQSHPGGSLALLPEICVLGSPDIPYPFQGVFLEINKDQPHEEAQSVCPGLIIARGAVTVARIWQRLTSR